LVRRWSFKLGVSGCEHCDLAGSDGNIRSFHRIQHALERMRVRYDLPHVAFIAQIFAAVLEHDIRQLLFSRSGFLDIDNALLRKHEAHRAGLAEVPAILGEGMTNLADRAVAVV